MSYSDKVRAEVAARYGVPVRCPVQIIPPGVVAIHADSPGPVVADRARRPARSAARREAVALRDGGQRFQEVAHRFSRSLSDIRTLAG